MNSATHNGLKGKLLTGAAALVISTGAQADLIDGIVDIWNVNVSTVFDATTICDSTGACAPAPTGITVVNPQSLRWGTPTTSGQSGMDIGNSPSNANVTTNGAAVNNISVTHLNRPIAGGSTSLRAVDILSTLTLTPSSPAAPGLPAAQITFGVSFLETPNGADPCANGGANGVGVNINGCADIFVSDTGFLNNLFMYDLDGAGPLAAQQYFISFFEATTGLNPLSNAACAAAGVAANCLGFLTPEGQDTTLQFAAVITTERITVPEPGALALLGLGLAGLGWSRRKSA